MKKLVIAAAIVCAAAFAQAGTVKWTITNVYHGNTTDTVSGSAYMFATSGGYTTSTIIDAITDAWTKGYGENAKGAESLVAFMDSKALGTGGTAYTWTGSEGTFSQTTAIDQADLGLAGSTSYTLFAVVFDDTVANFDGDTKFYVTNGKTATTKGDSATNFTTFGIGNQTTASQNGDNWHAVPEPTSGLLMLLGMAGLALRRRRA